MFTPNQKARHGHSVDPAERNNEHSETINCLADTLVSTPDTLNIIHTCIPCVLTGSHLTRSHPWDHAPLDAMAISHVVIHAITNAPGGIADNVQFILNAPSLSVSGVKLFTGRKGKEVAEQGESAQFGLLVGAAAAHNRIGTHGLICLQTDLSGGRGHTAILDPSWRRSYYTGVLDLDRVCG
ncbi:unnamed protein product [Rhizoctonia solani]|uniref:Uncharacterized protein n=1 Tax=Rhizoctonia solani TaxID=456999 RepID=A0A8H2X5U0_9AGAM|nr:unnamed protein product [Rhizoctonia solani]